MPLTRSSQYAIELVLYLMSHNSGTYFPLNKVAEETGLSFHYLSKIARMLTRVQLLTSYRGPHGGVALARSADRITLFDIVSAIEGEDLFNQCLLRPAPCDEAYPCPAHDLWLPIRDRIQHLFMKTSIEAFRIANDGAGKLKSGRHLA
ncbi:MAG: RrF2 family transcriptional regulator [Fidelibacterota bacterium]